MLSATWSQAFAASSSSGVLGLFRAMTTWRSFALGERGPLVGRTAGWSVMRKYLRIEDAFSLARSSATPTLAVLSTMSLKSECSVKRVWVNGTRAFSWILGKVWDQSPVAHP